MREDVADDGVAVEQNPGHSVSSCTTGRKPWRRSIVAAIPFKPPTMSRQWLGSVCYHICIDVDMLTGSAC